MPRRPGLWSAIGLNLGLLTLSVSILDAAVFYVATDRALGDAANDLAVTTATVLAAELGAAGPDGWKRVVDAHRRAGTRALTLYGPSGAVVAGEPVTAPAEVRATFFSRELTISEADGAIVVLAPVGTPGPPAAVLSLHLPVTEAGAPPWLVVGAHAVFSAGMIVAFGLVLFRGSLLRPLASLRESTRRIAAGELGVQVDEDAPAELAELADALNTMSTALAGYRERTAEQLARLETANEELRHTQEALVRSEKLASVGRLAAGLAHELGNPLTAVRGYVEILSLGGVDGSDEIVRRCGAEVERMHRILRTLLDYARASDHEVADVDVAELLRDAADTVRHQAAFRDVILDVTVRGDPRLRGEAAKLHQVLVNLLLNAADASARHVALSAEATPEEVLLRCKDDGDGIHPEHLSRLFEPFFTTRAPGKGTGLGLAVSHKILEQHGGRIEATSTVGEGSTFTLRLPAA